MEADKESFRSQLEAASRKRKVELEDEMNSRKRNVIEGEDELNTKKKKVIEEDVEAKKSRASKVSFSFFLFQQFFNFSDVSGFQRCRRVL